MSSSILGGADRQLLDAAHPTRARFRVVSGFLREHVAVTGSTPVRALPVDVHRTIRGPWRIARSSDVERTSRTEAVAGAAG